MTRILLFILCLSLASYGSAQGALPSDAQQALAQGGQAAARALATYDRPLLDLPLWREAISFGEQAKDLAPNHPEPYRFLGQVYATVQWWSRSWEAWTRYLELGGVLNAQSERYVIDTSRWLGNSSYQNGNYAAAIQYYGLLHRIRPDSEEANQHLALSHLALNQPELAQSHLETLATLYPDRPDYPRLLARTEEQATYGIEASNAYHEGLEHYAADRKTAALEAFQRATVASNNFREPFVWAGRVHLELGQPGAAIPFWQRAVDLRPGDQEARSALATAVGQNRWGPQAYTSFQQGLRQYEQGNVSAAQQSFAQVVSLNAQYADAWAWLGRIAYETGNYEAALSNFTTAVSLSPNNGEFAQGLQIAQGTLEQQRQTEAAAQAEAEARAQAETAAQAQNATPLVEAQTPAETASEPPPQPLATDASPTVRTTESPVPVAVATPLPAPIPSPGPEPSPQTSPTPSPEPSTIGAATPVTLIDLRYIHRSPQEGGTGAFSFFASPPTLLSNLTGPVNYARGVLYQRLQVMSKPSDDVVQYQICLVHNGDLSIGPACSATSNLRFSGVGVYESSQPMTSLSNHAAIDWSKGLQELMLIIKDAEGNAADDRYTFQAGEGAPLNLSQYYPMEVRYTAILVPEGGRFPGWP